MKKFLLGLFAAIGAALAIFFAGKRQQKAQQAAKEADDKAESVKEEVKAMDDQEVLQEARKWVRNG